MWEETYVALIKYDLTRKIPPGIIRLLLTVKATTLIVIFGRVSAVSSALEGKLGFIYNLVKSYINLFGPRKRARIS